MNARVGVISKEIWGESQGWKWNARALCGLPGAWQDKAASRTRLPFVVAAHRAAGLTAVPLSSRLCHSHTVQRCRGQSRVRGLVCTLLLHLSDKTGNSLGSEELSFVSPPSVSSTVFSTGV